MTVTEHETHCEKVNQSVYVALGHRSQRCVESFELNPRPAIPLAPEILLL